MLNDAGNLEISYRLDKRASFEQRLQFNHEHAGERFFTNVALPFITSSKITSQYEIQFALENLLVHPSNLNRLPNTESSLADGSLESQHQTNRIMVILFEILNIFHTVIMN